MQKTVVSPLAYWNTMSHLHQAPWSQAHAVLKLSFSGGCSRGCSMFKRRETREPSDSTISRRGKLIFCTKMEGPKIIWALEVWKIGLNFGICRPSISEVYCLFKVRLFHKSRKMTVKCVTIALLAISKLLIFYTLTVSNNNRKSIHAQTFSKEWKCLESPAR